MFSRTIKSKHGEFVVYVDDVDDDLLSRGLRIRSNREKSGWLRLIPIILKENAPNKHPINYYPLYRVIGERALGRRLKAIEGIHHLDNNRFNNRRQNLLIVKNSPHSKLHQMMGAAFAEQNFQSPISDEKIQLLHQLLSHNTQVISGVRVVL